MLPNIFTYTVESSRTVFGKLCLAVKLCLAENRPLILGDYCETACLGCMRRADSVAYVLKSLLHQHSHY